jgi:hypothetical protein
VLDDRRVELRDEIRGDRQHLLLSKGGGDLLRVPVERVESRERTLRVEPRGGTSGPPDRPRLPFTCLPTGVFFNLSNDANRPRPEHHATSRYVPAGCYDARGDLSCARNGVSEAVSLVGADNYRPAERVTHVNRTAVTHLSRTDCHPCCRI